MALSIETTDYTVLAKFRNKEAAQTLIQALRAKGKTCYDFFDMQDDPYGAEMSPEERMKHFEQTQNFFADANFRMIFEKDLNGLKKAETVIVLLPAGNAVHIEAGIAFGLGKKLIVIGEIEKPESLYLIFNEHYKTIEEFLETIK
jgi:nucleoside 2-deoxyribosyltransferase